MLRLRNQVGWQIILLLSSLFFLSFCKYTSSSEPFSGVPAFRDVSVSAGVSYSLGIDTHVLLDRESGGIAVADINNNGLLDFFVAHGTGGSGRLFINKGDGTFMDVTATSGITTTHQARAGLFADIDGDGWVDLLVTEVFPTNVTVFKNNGNNTFTEITDDVGLKPLGATFSLSAGDFNQSGYLDIAVAQYHLRGNPDSFDGWLWQNNGDGTFTDVTDLLPIPPQKNPVIPESNWGDWQWNMASSFSDINNDGYADLLMVANYKNSNIYLNDKSGGFNLLTGSVFDDDAGMGLAVGDYDNDGNLDWFISSIYHPDPTFLSFYGANTGNRMYKNVGDGSFVDATDETGVRKGHFGWAACFADFNNDGYQDLFHVNGYGDTESDFGSDYLYYEYDPAVFFLNNGNGTFTEMAFEIGLEHSGQGRGVSCWDYDNDGYVDIIVANLGSSPNLYRNVTKKVNNYLHVKLKGLSPNHEGVGAKVWITVNGQRQLREMRLGSNYLSNDPVIAYFGVARETLIEKVEVEWNDSAQSITVLNNVEANQVLEIVHPDL